MQAKHILIIFMLVATVAALSGCTSPTPTATPVPTNAPAAHFPVTISDSFGRTATLTKAPEKIISLSAANTEMLFALGLGNKIVGTDDYSDYPAEAKNITHVSGFSTVSYEKIAAANPDLIVAEDIIGEEAVTKLRSLGYNVIELKNSNISSIRTNILKLGNATGAVSNATDLVNTIDGRISGISAKTAQLNDSQKPSVLLLAGYLTGQPIYVYGSGTYGDELITLTGGKNAAGNITEYKVMSTEAIIKADPDYIILPVDGTMTTVNDFNNIKFGNESWMKGLKAVKNGHVIMVDGNLMMHPGPRLTDAGIAMARAIHPELFP